MSQFVVDPAESADGGETFDGVDKMGAVYLVNTFDVRKAGLDLL